MLKLAQVTQVYPGSRTVDLVFLHNNLACAAVSVMAGSIGSDHGVWDLPSVKKPASSAEIGQFGSTGRNLFALCGFYGESTLRPIVMGFMRPQGSAVVFNQDDREVHLHPSGTYTTVAPDGSYEVYTPGGGYLRVGTGGHEDLAGVAANGWSPPTSETPPTITVSNGKSTLVMDPAGNVTLTAAGNLVANIQGTATVSAAVVAIEAPDVTAGADGATYQRLATETFVLATYNAHTHEAPNGVTSGPSPVAGASDMTVNLKAS
jgi:hypothetical protein